MIAPKWKTKSQQRAAVSENIVRLRAVERIALLNHRLGVGIGAVKERMKLDKILEN